MFAWSTRLEWAVMMKRTFGFAVLRCPRCSRQMRVIATITEPAVVRQILDHLRVRASPLPRAPARDPSSGADGSRVRGVRGGVASQARRRPPIVGARNRVPRRRCARGRRNAGARGDRWRRRDPPPAPQRVVARAKALAITIRLGQRIAASELRPVVGASWPLRDGRAAFEAKQRGGQPGKAVLLLTDDR